jgi:hypothetical protein
VARTSYAGVNISDFDIRAPSQGDIRDEIFGICGNLWLLQNVAPTYCDDLLPLSAIIVPIKAIIFCNHRSTAPEVNAFACLYIQRPAFS